jgi:hypothetical protein
LEDEIRGYRTKLETADSDDKRMYADLIKSTRRTLDKLILQQAQQQKREERQLLAQQKQSSRGNLS